MDRPFPLHQDVFKAPAPPIQVTPVHEGDANAPALLAALLDALGDAPLGLAGAYDKCKLTHIALAAPEAAVILRFAAPGKSKSKKAKARPAPTCAGRTALTALLTSPTVKLGTNVDRLAVALFLDHGLRLAGAADVFDLAPPKTRGEIVGALGGPGVLGDLDRVKRVFASEGFSAQEVPMLALRAWACGTAGARDGVATALAQAPRYNTSSIALEVRLPTPLSRQPADPFSRSSACSPSSSATRSASTRSSRRRSRMMSTASTPSRARPSTCSRRGDAS
jgi:hypothetical protein